MADAITGGNGIWALWALWALFLKNYWLKYETGSF